MLGFGVPKFGVVEEVEELKPTWNRPDSIFGTLKFFKMLSLYRYNRAR